MAHHDTVDLVQTTAAVGGIQVSEVVQHVQHVADGVVVTQVNANLQ